MVIENIIIEGFLLTYCVFITILNYKERKTLYDRLMAKNLVEFSNHEISRQKIKIPDTKIQDELIRL